MVMIKNENNTWKQITHFNYQTLKAYGPSTNVVSQLIDVETLHCRIDSVCQCIARSFLINFIDFSNTPGQKSR